MTKRKKSYILPVSGRRGIVDDVPVARRAQKRAERSRREADRANQMTRDYAIGRREGNYDGSGASRIMPLISEE